MESSTTSEDETLQEIQAKKIPSRRKQNFKNGKIRGRKKIYWCPFCDCTSASKILIDNHLNEHLNINPFNCDTCDAKFPSQVKLKTHEKKHERDSCPTEKSECPKCKKFYLDVAAHDKRVHSSSIKRLICNVCGKSLRYKNELAFHLRTHDPKEQFPCKFCAKLYTWVELKTHELTHPESTPFKCEQCDEKFKHEMKLRVHLAQNHEGPPLFKCKFCEKGFITRDQFSLHETYYCKVRDKSQDSTTHTCDQCGMSFNHKRPFYQHYLKHFKKYECKTCNKKFSRPDYLRKHMVTHVEEKSFLCEDCGKSFNRSDNLKIHLKSKTGCAAKKICIREKTK